MRRRRNTFSKKAVKYILIIAMIDLQLSYVLAFLGREQIAETLSVTVVVEIVGVMLGYFLKSFKETKEEEQIRLLEKEQEKENYVKDMKKEVFGNDVAG